LAEHTPHVCVVGDDDQSIYAWRGADPTNIADFNRRFPGVQEITLDQNYRSTNNILTAANHVIQHNLHRKPKALWSAGGAGDPVDIVACSDGDDEATFVVDQVRRLLADGVAKDAIAILYRANVQSRIFEELFALERIPFRVVGGQAFFERKEVKDVLAYLAVVQNPRDEVALRRIVNPPPRGIGPTSVERLVRFGAESRQGLWGALRDAAAVDELPPAAVVGARGLVGILGPAGANVRGARKGELSVAVRALVQSLGRGQQVTERFDYTVSDGIAAVASSLSVTVTGRRYVSPEKVVSTVIRHVQIRSPAKTAPIALPGAMAIVSVATAMSAPAIRPATMLTLLMLMRATPPVSQLYGRCAVKCSRHARGK